jgi:hypothetical protein
VEAPVDTPASGEVPYWSVDNDNPTRSASRLRDCEEGDAPEMTLGVLIDYPATVEVFSAVLPWAFLAFSSAFLLLLHFLLFVLLLLHESPVCLLLFGRKILSLLIIKDNKFLQVFL